MTSLFLEMPVSSSFLFSLEKVFPSQTSYVLKMPYESAGGHQVGVPLGYGVEPALVAQAKGLCRYPT